MQYIIWMGLLSAFGTRKTAYFLERHRELYSSYFKRGFKGLPLKVGPAQVSTLFWSLQKKMQRREGVSTLKLPPMFSY